MRNFVDLETGGRQARGSIGETGAGDPTGGVGGSDAGADLHAKSK